MMNHRLLLLFMSIALWVCPTNGQDEDEPICEDGKKDGYHAYFKDVCFPNKLGYNTCQKHWDWVTRTGSTSLKTVKCAAGSECRCFVSWWEEQECACVDATPTPQFPATGVIRWTGKEYFDNEYKYASYDRVNRKVIFKHNNLREANLSGEVHMDESGRFLLKETKVDDWETDSLGIGKGWNWREGNKDPAVMTKKVVMVIPNADGTFTKYEKKDNNKCKKSTVQSGMTLSSIWRKRPRTSNNYFSLVGRTKASENVETQEWNMKQRGDGWDYSWTWFMDYDKVQHHAIPTKFVFFPTSEEGNYEKRELHYNYQPLKEGEKTFDVADFCS